MSAISQYTHRINDPIHGTILLSDVEIAVIGTQAFQRLHNVYQLGFAHHVFPGANYSRFAHSLGACHIAGRLLNAINLNNPDKLTDQQIQVYRLAALLHDIGHYPFSHAMEHAIRGHYAGQKFLVGSTPSSDAEETFRDLSLDNEPASYDHELMGKRIMSYDTQLTKALQSYGYSHDDIIGAFAASGPGSLIHVLSSDLDCDRLDYLMRTAHHAGMPYGAVDIDYIVSQATIDEDGIFCFRQQGLKAADHLLISRFFDYQQVPFHKTVVGLELLLEQVLAELFALGEVQCSAADMLRRIDAGSWAHFDDQHMIGVFRAFLQSGEKVKAHGELALKISALLNRNPPRLLASFERLAARNGDVDRIVYSTILNRFKDRVGQWAEKTGIPETRWMCWDTSFPLTKIGPTTSVSKAGSRPVEDEEERAVRLLSSRSLRGGGTSKPIMDFDQALMRPLSQQLYDAIRIYVLLDASEGRDGLRATAGDLLKTEFEDIPFMIT